MAYAGAFDPLTTSASKRSPTVAPVMLRFSGFLQPLGGSVLACWLVRFFAQPGSILVSSGAQAQTPPPSSSNSHALLGFHCHLSADVSPPSGCPWTFLPTTGSSPSTCELVTFTPRPPPSLPSPLPPKFPLSKNGAPIRSDTQARNRGAVLGPSPSLALYIQAVPMPRNP